MIWITCIEDLAEGTNEDRRLFDYQSKYLSSSPLGREALP